MENSEKLQLIKRIVENCLEFDGDKGTAMDDVLTVIAFEEEGKKGEENGNDRC